MTKEISQIISAFEKVDFTSQKAALATVVSVEGSSYRRPGARMLITDDGKLTGAISGGCLEGDALRKARLVMMRGEAMVVTYDTSDDDDAKLGVGLGCNGIIRILIEPIDPAQSNHAIRLLQLASQDREPAVLVTLFSLQDSRLIPPGTCFLLSNHAREWKDNTVNTLAESVLPDALEALNSGQSITTSYHGNLTAFVECLEPVPSLVIVGAGNDVIPLTELSAVLGWETIVLDGRSSYAKIERFPSATKVILAKPEQLFDHISFDSQSYFLLMTHNYKYDLAVLRQLLVREVRYIGVLGPKKKLYKLLGECEDLTYSEQSPVYGPVGLDIGAETAEEIALAILAEIKAVSSGKQGYFLRNIRDSIHAEGHL